MISANCHMTRGLIYKRCVRTKWAYNMHKQFSTHISGFITVRSNEVRSNEVNDFKLGFHFDMHLGHSMEMSIFLSLAFTEILHLKNTLGLQFLYIFK